jgi:hypothetical protein
MQPHTSSVAEIKEQKRKVEQLTIGCVVKKEPAILDQRSRNKDTNEKDH